ncbi:MAG: M36 family metallopeptidase, partial [Moheibacter sp.]
MVHRALSQSNTDKTLTADDLNFELTDFYSNPKSGIRHIYLRQTLNGLEIIGTESSIHVSKTGKVTSVSNKFLNSIQKKGSQSPASPQIDAVQAVSSAAMQLGYHPTKGFSVISQSLTADKKSMISDGGISLSDIPARLMYFADEDGNISLVWDISIEAVSQTEWYSVRVDAKNGKIIDKVNWTNSCNFGFSVTDSFTPGFGKINYSPFTPQFNFNPNVAGTYNVFARPLESPLYGGRTMVLADDAVNFNASPYGWHDTDGSPGPEFNTTRGNNVNAYEDGDHSGYQPDGGSSLIFDFPFNMNYSSGNQYEDAAITNLFYWNNIIHDVFYEYGFNEVGGNFQQNNYGKGGAGNDYVNAEAQDASGTCNANFSTPPDGTKPRMQMYICGNRDGDFDNMVIAHEYGHGISNRLTGGPSNVNCLNNQEQMGEGWSDFFGLMLTMNASDQGSDSRGVGTYLFGEGPGGAGIRTYPYSTNMSVNPHTYNSIKTEVAPHGVGSVWCAMLWEMTWGLIDEYGFDPDIYNGNGGNNIALQLVVEGLALQPCSPGFVDGRDAILLADQMLYGGANQCIIWDAFAKRGLGYSANQGSSGSKNDGTEAFDTPSATAAFTAPGDVCEDRGVMTNLSGGTPMGGVYSGPGVTDNGNGMTYSFDPSVAGVGVHTITYSLPATQCANASSASDEIEVTAAIQFDCPEDIEVETVGGDCSVEVSFATPDAIRNCTILSGENFDGVAVPNLPSGWTTQTDQGTTNNWITVNNQSSSSPNSAFAANLGSTSLSSLTSPEFQIASANAKLKFDIRHICETGYDGAVLEYTTDNGATWNDILNGGGTFASGGYTHTLSTSFGNPLGGRQAWSGSATTFKNAVVNLNASMNGQTVKFRWRMGSDVSVGSTGVWIDSIEVEGVPDPAPITVSQTEGLPSGSAFPVGTNVVTFQADDGDGNVTTCSFNIIVTDAIAPVINCPADMSVSIPAGGTYTLPDYWANGDVTATDNCSSIAGETQNPVAGTQMNPGVHTIQFTATDSSGNSANCSFQLTVSEDGGGGSDACFEEDFSDIVNGNSTETTGSGTVWNGNSNFPTVEKAYQAGGAVKLGTGSLIGSIESRDLTEVSGDISVNIMVKGWTNVEGDLKVSIDGQEQILSYTAKMADPFELVTATFTGVAAGSKLKIETTAKRAFIDNVEIICDGSGGGGDDCDQGDDSNEFENAFNIIAGGTYRNADDFFVSSGNTLNIQQIELNVFASSPFATMN